MSPNLNFLFIFVHLCVLCQGKRTVWDLFSPTCKQSETIDSDSNQLSNNRPNCALASCILGQYNTIPGLCKSETPAEVKYSGYEYSQQTGHWYKFHANPVVNWTTALDACITEGARLAVPNSIEEAKFIMTLHARYTNAEILNTDWLDWVSVGVFWNGNMWATIDGTPLATAGYTKWLKGCPGNDHSYLYMVMNRGGEYNTTRSELYPYVCEKEHVKAIINIDFQ